MVALMGRRIPRDLYDFYYLTEKENMELEEVYTEFMRKAENKEHNPRDFLAKVKSKETSLKMDWEKILSGQMRKGELPPFNEVWRKASVNLKKLMKLIEK
jgi:predicted nucleotidyltransferase component of viral defense system